MDNSLTNAVALGPHQYFTIQVGDMQLKVTSLIVGPEIVEFRGQRIQRGVPKGRERGFPCSHQDLGLVQGCGDMQRIIIETARISLLALSRLGLAS